MFITYYFLTGIKSRQKNTIKSFSTQSTVSLTSSTEALSSSTPFLLFNSISPEKTLTISKGTTINKNLYIIEGIIEIIYNNTRIGILQTGQVTYNGFDLLNLNFGIEKRAVSDVLVSEVPGTCDRFLALKILEKTCFEPALRFCKFYEQVVKLETLKTTNFEEFILKNFKISNHNIAKMSVEKGVELEDCVYYVVSGSLVINGKVFEKGSVFGYLGVFFNYYKGFTCTATEPSILKYIPYNKIGNKVDLDLKVIEKISSPLICLGATLDWRHVSYGEYIFRKNTRCDYISIVDGIEYGCKECIVGARYELDLVAEKTVNVIRISKLTIDCLIKEVPLFYTEISKKMFDKTKCESKIVLITPVVQKCDLFIVRLSKTVGNDAVFLKNTKISEILGKNVFDKIGELVLSEYLNRLKLRHKVVIVYLENEYSRMLKIIQPYCDIIFLTGSEIVPNNFERNNVEFVKLYERRRVVKKKSKIKSAILYGMFYEGDSDESESEVREVSIDPLLTKENTLLKGSSSNDGLFKTNAQLLNMKYRRVHHILSPKEANFCNKDYERFSRYLTGERFGLVLGGGGARGYAHIGVIKALEEENIPIDVVGGTSMGAFIGALYARELDFVEVYKQAKRMSRSGSSRLNFLLDLCFPFISIFAGKNLDRELRKIFNDQQIQNFWLEYYCVTTDLKRLDQSVHFNGSAFKYIRSSMAVAGLVPPVFYKNEILCDGAYVNNIPTDVMASLDVKNIVSVRVCRDFDNVLNRYDSLSGLILFFKSIFLSKIYLTLADTQYRLSFLTTNKKIELLSNESLVITPDLGAYKVSDFNKFDEIVACGYEAAKTKIKEWKASGKIKEFKKQVRRFSI
jgi:lysophospholipid hydrolase